MFSETQLERYAEVLLWALHTGRINPYREGDIILIRYDRPAIRLAEILFERVLKEGMHPIQRMTGTPIMEKRFYEIGDEDQLTFRPPGEEELCRRLNGNIFLYAPESITHLSGVDPKKIGKAAVARKYLRDILTGREESGEFSWTLCAFPTPELAGHANLSPSAYAEQIVRACFLDAGSPVDEWRRVYENALEIKKWLNSLGVRSLHVASESLDLTIAIGDQRRWIGLSGHNIPSFEIFVSPDWRGTAGRYVANQPSYRSGNYVEGVTLRFEKGEAVEVRAEKGEGFIRDQLAMDEGAKRVGEFSLTDRRFSRIDTFMANTLFDENYGGEYGNCHLALGSSYSDTYDGNPADLTEETKKRLGFNDSALHWDLVNTERKQVTATLASGERIVIYEDGQFNY
jgi:aminopeptidase